MNLKPAQAQAANLNATSMMRNSRCYRLGACQWGGEGLGHTESEMSKVEKAYIVCL